MGFGDPEMIEECSEVVSVGVILPKSRESGLTVASQVVTNDAVMFGEGLELVVPHTGVEGEPVDQNQRRPRPCYLIV
jgi:hypothetical protein